MPSRNAAAKPPLYDTRLNVNVGDVLRAISAVSDASKYINRKVFVRVVNETLEFALARPHYKIEFRAAVYGGDQFGADCRTGHSIKVATLEEMCHALADARGLVEVALSPTRFRVAGESIRIGDRRGYKYEKVWSEVVRFEKSAFKKAVRVAVQSVDPRVVRAYEYVQFRPSVGGMYVTSTGAQQLFQTFVPYASSMSDEYAEDVLYVSRNALGAFIFALEGVDANEVRMCVDMRDPNNCGVMFECGSIRSEAYVPTTLDYEVPYPALSDKYLVVDGQLLERTASALYYYNPKVSDIRVMTGADEEEVWFMVGKYTDRGNGGLMQGYVSASGDRPTEDLDMPMMAMYLRHGVKTLLPYGDKIQIGWKDVSGPIQMRSYDAASGKVNMDVLVQVSGI